MSSADRSHSDRESCIYLCGHSLGLQPKRTAERVRLHLAAWAQKGVYGHFTEHSNSPEPPFLHSDDAAAQKMAPIVGALRGEVAVMETLTANLHFMMAAFYRPTRDKYKILIEGKAFPSDHVRVDPRLYAVRDRISWWSRPSVFLRMLMISPGFRFPLSSRLSPFLTFRSMRRRACLEGASADRTASMRSNPRSATGDSSLTMPWWC
jgi:hypothetical protein